MSIDVAGQADLVPLAALMASSPLLRRYGTSLETAQASLRRAVADDDLLLIARAASAAAAEGLAWLSFAPRILNGAAYLRLLLVARPGNGLGARLLDAAEAAARPRANHLYLLATTDNAAARRFYAHHGYRHVGDLTALVDPDLDEALYHKPLRDYADRLSG
jgi:GNAT superfamily N-acetyltransferase